MRRLLAGAAMLCAVLAVFGIPACGKKSTQPKTTTGSTIPISNGTWEITIHTTSSVGTCGNVEDVDTTVIDNGLSDLFVDDCDYVITGSNFTHVCVETLSADTACVALASYDAAGTFTSTTFNMVLTLTFASTPPGCSIYPECVIHLTVSGRRLHAEPQARLRPSGPQRHGIARYLLRR
jgi:hypothetical protein